MSPIQKISLFFCVEFCSIKNSLSTEIPTEQKSHGGQNDADVSSKKLKAMIFFDLFQFNFLNGRLLHVDNRQ